MKPFFVPFPALFATASAWYYCCFCCISHAGTFYAEAFLASPSSMPAGHARSQLVVTGRTTSSSRWHNKTATAAASNTGTCSATASHRYSLSRLPRTTTATQLPVAHRHDPTHQRRRYSAVRRCALSEGAPEGSSANSSPSGAATPTKSEGPEGAERAVNGVGGVPSEVTTVPGDTASPRAGGEPGRGGGGAGKGLEGRLISRLSRRVADSFPLLTADEIKKEIRALLNPETKGEPKAASAGSSRDESLSALVKEVRELVEELMEQVGVNEAKSLADLKDFTQKFKGVLRGDPATVQELRAKVLDDLEEVRDEIAELIEVEELSKARERLEKATAESTEMVFDSVVTAMVTGLDTVINEGKGVIQEGEETETFQVSTYFYGKDNEFWDDMQANGVTPRRVFLYSLLGAGVAFGGNLFGVTSVVLGSLAPEASRDARLDVLFPVGGFKRYYSAQDGYEFIYPQAWVGDSGLALKQQRDLEETRAAPSVVSRARQRRAGVTAPEVAFGPPGGDGGENVSVVKSELMGGFSLTGTLGKPKEAAEKLLSTFIAPPESGREWELLGAFGETRAPGGLVYQFEYRIKGKGIRRPMHNVGVVVARGSTLFTVTVLAPEERWANGRGEKFREMAKSFRLSY